MPAYLVSLLAHPGRHLAGGASDFVVFAGSVADARATAKAAFDYDGSAKWDAATVTEIVAGTDLSAADFQLAIKVLDSDPVIDMVTLGTGISAESAAITAGGGTYSVNDVLTCVGGTFTRAATFRVTSVNAGAVDGIELLDPGEYTVAPTGALATTVLPNNGSACTLTPVFGTDGYASRFAEMVGLLNASAIIAGAAVDMGATPPLFTIAAIADGIGDKIVVVEYRMNGVAIPGLLGTIVDEGVAGAVLTVEGIAAPVLPNLAATLRA